MDSNNLLHLHAGRNLDVPQSVPSHLGNIKFAIAG